MNLYNLHDNSESLDLHDEAHDQLPSVFWEKYKDNPAELKKREKYIAKDPVCSYYYARDVLKDPFKAGEAAIAKNAEYSYFYARDILKGPFKAGEAAIAASPVRSYMYAVYILKGPFKLGEEAISKSEYKEQYEKLFGYKI
jgi:hypothetical protein